MRKSVYGGQALIEGLMIKGPDRTSIALRQESGEIHQKLVQFSPAGKSKQIPIVRGVVEFFRMNAQGIKALFYSAEQVDLTEEEPTKFERFLQEKLGDKLEKVVLTFTVIVSVAFSVGLFMLLPNFLVSLFAPQNALLASAIEGLTRLAIFTLYLGLTSRLGEMKRIWMYHGAEHKTIHCYEHEEELTVENVRKYTTLHPRCGTSFLFLVMMISIVLYSFVGWHGVWMNLVLRLALLPVIAGVSYEVFRVMGRSENALVRLLCKPGMMFQKFTTMEPDDDQIEVAIVAFRGAMQEGDPVELW